MIAALWLGCAGPASPPTSPRAEDSGAPPVPSPVPSSPDDTADTAIPSSTGSTAETGAPAGQEALIGVGYGGLRVVSRDGGLTWTDRAAFSASGGDDEDLLRAVAYGEGLWLATGWRSVTSTDGVTWTDHGMIADEPDWPPCNIVEGLTWAEGAFFAACTDWYGQGNVYRSEDAEIWAEHGTIGETGGHLFLAWNEGTFAAYGDFGTSWTSTDAASWTVLPGVERATWCDGAYRSQDECHGASWFDGAWFRTQWPDVIERSTDGAQWDRVYQDPESNSLYQPRAIAKGLVPE